MFGYYIWKHVASVLARNVNLVVIFIALLYYYLRSAFIAIKYFSSAGLSVLELALPFFIILPIVFSAFLCIDLLEQGASLWAAGSACGQLALFILLKLLHNFLRLIWHGQEISRILEGLVLLFLLFGETCHHHPGFAHSSITQSPFPFLRGPHITVEVGAAI